MLSARSGHAITFLKGEIYVIGGYTDDDDEKDFSVKCEKYSILNN